MKYIHVRYTKCETRFYAGSVVLHDQSCISNASYCVCTLSFVCDHLCDSFSPFCIFCYFFFPFVRSFISLIPFFLILSRFLFFLPMSSSSFLLLVFLLLLLLLRLRLLYRRFLLLCHYLLFLFVVKSNMYCLVWGNCYFMTGAGKNTGAIKT